MSQTVRALLLFNSLSSYTVFGLTVVCIWKSVKFWDKLWIKSNKIKLDWHPFASGVQILFTHNAELLSFPVQLTFRRLNPLFVTGAIFHFFFTMTSLSTMYICTVFFMDDATRICYKHLLKISPQAAEQSSSTVGSFKRSVGIRFPPLSEEDEGVHKVRSLITFSFIFLPKWLLSSLIMAAPHDYCLWAGRVLILHNITVQPLYIITDDLSGCLFSRFDDYSLYEKISFICVYCVAAFIVPKWVCNNRILPVCVWRCLCTTAKHPLHVDEAQVFFV
jgi:hypothetical protein